MSHCTIAPRGWYCTRTPNHPGTCAAWPQWWAHPLLWLRYHQ